MIESRTHGPLAGIRIVEFAGLGPGPFAAMMLSDLGADVVRVDQPGRRIPGPRDVVTRGRCTVHLDLKSESDRDAARSLVLHSDVLVEGFRPGVMERLGLAPADCRRSNPRLIYARMTGWGRSGPYRDVAGHDINYIALSGTLAHLSGPDGHPVPPLNLVGDYGGGAVYLVVGVLAALIERARSGLGQEIDASMIDGTASLMSSYWGFRGLGDSLMGVDEQRPASRMLDGGAPYYGVYECSDGKFVSIGAIETKFYSTLVGLLGLADDPDFHIEHQNDRSRWDVQRSRLEQLFRSRSQAHWCETLERSDACFAPVLTMTEALMHPHNVARGVFVDVEGVPQPGPAPRFSRTPSPTPQPNVITTIGEILARWQSGRGRDSAELA